MECCPVFSPRTPLLEESGEVDVDQTEAYLQVAPSPWGKAEEGLSKAVQEGNLAGVLESISNGADIHMRDWPKGRNVLHMAETAEIMQVLLNSKADVTLKDLGGTTPLGCHCNDLTLVELLLDHGADVNERSSLSGAFGMGTFSLTPLMTAASFDKKDVMSFLIERKADVRKKIAMSKNNTSDALTPFCWAVAHGDDEITMLLARGPAIDIEEGNAFFQQLTDVSYTVIKKVMEEVRWEKVAASSYWSLFGGRASNVIVRAIPFEKLPDLGIHILFKSKDIKCLKRAIQTKSDELQIRADPKPVLRALRWQQRYLEHKKVLDDLTDNCVARSNVMGRILAGLLSNIHGGDMLALTEDAEFVELMEKNQSMDVAGAPRMAKLLEHLWGSLQVTHRNPVLKPLGWKYSGYIDVVAWDCCMYECTLKSGLLLAFGWYDPGHANGKGFCWCTQSMNCQSPNGPEDLFNWQKEFCENEWQDGDIVGTAVDTSTGEAFFALNGIWRKVFQFPPPRRLQPWFMLNGEFTINCGSAPFRYPLPRPICRSVKPVLPDKDAVDSLLTVGCQSKAAIECKGVSEEFILRWGSCRHRFLNHLMAESAYMLLLLGLASGKIKSTVTSNAVGYTTADYLFIFWTVTKAFYEVGAIRASMESLGILSQECPRTTLGTVWWRMFRRGFADYSRDNWNKVDIVTISLNLFVLLIGFMAPNDEGIRASILSVSVLVSIFRLLYPLSLMNQDNGIMMITIFKMGEVLARYSVMITVLVIAFCVYFSIELGIDKFESLVRGGGVAETQPPLLRFFYAVFLLGFTGGDNLIQILEFAFTEHNYPLLALGLVFYVLIILGTLNLIIGVMSGEWSNTSPNSRAWHNLQCLSVARQCRWPNPTALLTPPLNVVMIPFYWSFRFSPPSWTGPNCRICLFYICGFMFSGFSPYHFLLNDEYFCDFFSNFGLILYHASTCVLIRACITHVLDWPMAIAAIVLAIHFALSIVIGFRLGLCCQQSHNHLKWLSCCMEVRPFTKQMLAAKMRNRDSDPESSELPTAQRSVKRNQTVPPDEIERRNNMLDCVIADANAEPSTDAFVAFELKEELADLKENIAVMLQGELADLKEKVANIADAVERLGSCR